MFRNKKSLFLLVLSVFWVSEVFANPEITSMSGAFSHGTNVTINGQFFGTKSTAEPLIWDDCETGSAGNKWDATYPYVAEDPDYNMQYRTTYRDVAQAHSQSTKYAVGGHCPIIGAWGNNKGPNVFLGKSVGPSAFTYASFYYRTDPQWPEGAGSNNNYKLWFYTSGYMILSNGFYVEYNPHPGTGSQEYHLNGVAPIIWVGNDPADPKDGWLKIELICKHSNYSDGWIKIYEDGVLKLDFSGSTNSESANKVMFGAFWRPGDGYDGTNAFRYFDDLYFDNTLSRIIIGNATTVSASTKREIQIPSAWSDTSITITANQGSFAPEENVYLFVVDTDGIPSAGYGPITIGSGEKGDDTTPPGDVTDLTIQAGDGLVALEWTNPTDSDFKGTMIRYRTDGTYPANNSDGIEVCNKTTPPGASDTYTLTGLSNGTTYYFSAFTYDEDGNYSEPMHISAVPSADIYTPPGDVTDLTIQAGDGQIAFSWINPMDSDFTGTMIRYRTDGIYPVDYDDGVEVCNKTANPGYNDTYTLTGLVNDIIYYFSVFTYDETDNYSEPMHISAVPSADIYTKVFGDTSGADFPQTCKDTYLNAGEAGVTYSSNSESLNTYTWPINTAANRIAMKWDLSALPQDAIIQEATLSLYMHEYSGDDNYEITAHKIINHNTDISSCTWNTYDATNSWTGGANGGEQDIASAESSTIVDKISGYKNWNITQMVRDWVDNSSTNLGLMLNSDTTAASDSNRYFRPSEYSNQDQRPILTIKCGSDIPKVPSAPTGLGVK